jgi:hypothetical protein
MLRLVWELQELCLVCLVDLSPRLSQTQQFTTACVELSLCTLIILVAVNLGLGLLPFVDNFAHIGGFLSGFLLGFLLLMKPQYGWMCHDELPLCIEVDLPVKTLAQSLSVCALHLIIPAKSGWFHWCFSFSLHWCGCQQEVFLVPLLELCSNCSLAL